MLNAEAHINDQPEGLQWKLCLAKDQNRELTLRSKTIISTVDDGNKIVILGGRDQNNAYCQAIEIFDPETRNVELFHSNIKFVTVFNPSVQCSKDTIVALGLSY